MSKTLVMVASTIIVLLLLQACLLLYIFLQWPKMPTGRIVDYSANDNGTLSIVADNGAIVTLCVINADCDN